MTNQHPPAATVVLVHGAWHGTWCWDRVTPLLEAQGVPFVLVERGIEPFVGQRALPGGFVRVGDGGKGQGGRKAGQKDPASKGGEYHECRIDLCSEIAVCRQRNKGAWTGGLVEPGHGALVLSFALRSTVGTHDP